MFDRKSFQFIGDISYSIYLVHLPLVFAYMTLRKVLLPDDPSALLFGYSFSTVKTWAGLVVFLVITLAGATLTYRYVEKPARKYLNKTRQPVAVA
jgi:peptidoglycan/LPS O-acetylase OafA/YrhL